MRWCCTPTARAPRRRSWPPRSRPAAAARASCLPISPTRRRCDNLIAGGGGLRAADAAGQQCRRVRARRDRDPRARRLRAHLGGEPGGAPVPGEGVRRAGAGRLGDRQRARPARVQADAALLLLLAEQERAAHRDHDAGAGAGAAACASTRWRRGRRCRARARRTPSSRSRPPACRSDGARRRRTSPPRCFIWRRRRSVTGVTIAVDGGQHLAWRTPDSDVAE